MTKLALLLPTLDPGGAERVMLDLGDAFAARGYDVDLVVSIPDGPIAGNVPPSIRVVDLGAKRTVASFPALVRYLRRERPAALLSTLEHTNVLAVGAARATGVRVVVREAAVLLSPEHWRRSTRMRILHRLMREAYRRADAVIAVSKAVEDDLAKNLDVPRDRLHTVYNPIVKPNLAERAAEPVDEPWLAAGQPPVVLGVGRLMEEKDFPTLLRAFAKVRKEREARLIILGQGELKDSLEALARELHIDADVKLAGYKKNPFAYMSRASLYVLCSTYEGLPGALIQAMACGCRVVSTDCPGGTHEIFEGTTGVIVPMRDPDRMAAAMLDKLADADRNPGRETHDVRRFAEADAVDKYLDLLGVPRRSDKGNAA